MRKTLLLLPVLAFALAACRTSSTSEPPVAAPSATEEAEAVDSEAEALVKDEATDAAADAVADASESDGAATEAEPGAEPEAEESSGAE